ncbi:folic acid synthesis protein-like protein [Calycina marina]|uniref:Folic acid synthesis protein FOL1 n=1 Tax=Calycina marina TaxID=1763456 RepID=A0A9P8CCD3_9HELO|nr:folic acid synthesis protein-like protein [Calycina marina]
MRTRSFSNFKATRWRVSTQTYFPGQRYCQQSPVARFSSSSTTLRKEWTPHALKPLGQDSQIRSSLKENHGIVSETLHTAYVALGSNLGDRIGMIERACNEMVTRGIKIKRTSSLWETEPMYVLDQASFINGVCEVSISVETTLKPLALLDQLQSIEKAMDRKKIIDKGPRNIDLDILLYDAEVVKHERLQIPHALMLEREFVLRPLAELIPGTAIDPKSPWKMTQDYLNALPESEGVSTVTPLTPEMEPLRALKVDRKTQVMSIINITPDSFSDHRALDTVKNTVSEIVASVQNKAVAIVDIGGQSTAPGATHVVPSTEAIRVQPLIKQLQGHRSLMELARKHFAISIDTFYASVARAAISSGADIINDVSAGAMDPHMLDVMARSGKTVILMHMRGTPATMNQLTDYPDGLIPTIAAELLQRIAAAEGAGVRRWRIILDPGIGFAKTAAQNLEVLQRLDELRHWPGLIGFPWVVGSSRKGFIGNITGVQRPDQRLMGTAATVAAAVQGGADIVRVHDAEEMAQVTKMADAIWRHAIRS